MVASVIHQSITTSLLSLTITLQLNLSIQNAITLLQSSQKDCVPSDFMAEEGRVESNSDSIILEEEIDPNYTPSDDEMLDYATWLGMDPVRDSDLLWIAREGLMVRIS